MKKTRLFKRLADSKSAKLLASIAVFLLVFPPQVFPLAQIVNKYVTTYSVRNDGDGRGDWGMVFNFNNAKSNGGTEADITETACRPESTNYTFDAGPDGFVGTRSGSYVTLTYDATLAAIAVQNVRRNNSETYKYERKFFYDCGQPSTVSFSLDYQVTNWVGAGASNNFSVALVKPDNTSVTLKSTVTLAGLVGWTNVVGTIAPSDLTQTGVYKLQINGAIQTTTTTGRNVRVLFDNVNLGKTSQYTDYRNDVEFTIKAAPYSSLVSGAYTLELRAKKLDAASDNVEVQVYNGATWTTKATINNTTNLHATDPDYSFALSTAEYNNGLVRVRYIDTMTTGDNTGGGIKIDYHRIKVDQGICVDFIQPVEADCGKCHNYGGDVTKPWPNTGMHNKHAQSETVADCKWCHPDFTANGTVFNMSHSDGLVTIDGSKIYDVAVTPTNGGTGTYAKATTKTCSNSNCHYNLTTPAWNAVYGTNIERNCSRCHNPGTPVGDNSTNLNIASSWPNTKAHAQHDVAFEMDEYSCQGNGSCHPDNRTQHTPVGDGSGALVKMAPNFNSPTGGTLKYIKVATALPNDGNGRCYNSTCHGGQETPKWDIALADSGGAINPATDCTKCHINESATTWTQGQANSSKQYNSSISGLHRGSPPTSGKSHVSDYGCTTCHNGEPAQHFKTAGGTTGLDTYLPIERPPAANFWGTVGYTVGAGAPPDFNGGTQAPTCATAPSATCHAEGNTAYRNPATSWKREWSWRSYSATEIDRCEVCHGHWGTFKGGVVQTHVNSNTDATQRAELMANHSDSGSNCGTMCHGQTDTTNYNHGVAMTAEAKTSDVNLNAGFVDNGTSVGCTGCHVANDGVGSGKHAFADATWVSRRLLTGPVVLCTSCHGADNATVGNVNYWPGGAGGSYPDRTGEHNIHIQALATKLGYPFTSALTDQQQKTMCAYCHTYSSYPGEGGHADYVAPATLTNPTSFNPLWSALTANYPSTADGGTAAALTGGNGVGGSCAGIDCHNNIATAATNEWYDASTAGCALCHSTDPTVQSTHVAHANAATNYYVNITCANCHGGSPVWGTPGTKPSGAIWGTSHINGTFTVSGGTTTFTYSGATYPTVKGSCGTNNCHRSDASANTAPVVATYTWGTTGLTGSCNFCHLEAMTSGEHATHLASYSLPSAAVNDCYVCHNSTATSGGQASGSLHMNAADDLNFNSTYQYEGTAITRAGTGTTTTCSSTKCHSGVTTPTWATASAVNCTNSCHNTGGTGPLPSAASVAGEHAAHANNDATYTDCVKCHPNAASYTAQGGHADHQNLALNVTVASATYTDTTEGGVNYQAGDASHTDDGTCAFTGGCHGSGANVSWATATTLSCAACHGGDNATIGNLNYWPGGAGATYPDRAGEHNVHVQKVAAKLGYPFTSAITDAQQKTICSFCHTSVAGENRVHADNTGPATVTSTSFNPLWSTVTGSPLTASTADGGTAAAYTPGNGTGGSCAGIDCHNNQATAATSEWYDASTGTCLLCHTIGGAGANPTSGLHNITVAGPQHHDDGITGGCGACHVMPAIAPSSTHINSGTMAADGASNADRGISRSGMVYTEITPASGRSGTCSGTGVNIANGCHTDNGNWARLWSTEANSTATATSSARCNVCHGQWSSIAGSTGWSAGTSHYKAGGLNTSTNSRGSGHDTTTCDNCHAYGASGNGRHNVVTRQINLNNNGLTPGRTGSVYGTDTAGCNQTGCHTNGWSLAGYNYPISYYPQNAVAGPAFPVPSCASCHGPAGSAPRVFIGTTANSSSPHVDADGPAGGTYTINVASPTAKCEDCHSGHADGTSGANDVEILTWSTSLNSTVPTMNYPYTTHSKRIKVGGTATSGSTEAEMCWACHDARGVSEWGTNQDATTGNSTYDFGDLYTNNSGTTKTSNWSTGFWRSGRGRVSTAGSGTNPYWYKRGAVQSTHSVNFDSGSTALTTTGNSLGFGRKETPDAVANIRCTWCHDVHGTHNGQNGDVSGGTGTNDAPYLRGSWKTSPYAEDGAPQLGQANWSNQGNKYGLVPRASASATNTGTTAVPKAGGWWIDQNSNHPNSQTTATATSGLCDQCHGTTKDGTWNTTEIGTIDYNTAGTGEANIWVSGYNGHANSVMNGPGRGTAGSAESYARNIFTRTKRGTSGMSTTGSAHAGVDMGIMSSTYSRGYSYRGSSGDGYAYGPSVGAENTFFQTFAWGTPGVAATGRTSIWATGSQALTMNNTVGQEPATYDAQDKYHNFTCSKCHNAHASRLPKLMITNCLDTNHNTWEDLSGHVASTSGLPVPWTNTRHSQWASAQTCHRLDARAALTSGMTVKLGIGWNRVTPWLEFTNPNSTRTTIAPSVPVP